MHLRLLMLATVLAGHVASGVARELVPFISTNTEITLLTGNDAAASPTVRRQDSFTVIRLRPDAPPTSRTVYGETPHTVLSIPRLTIIDDGQYGIITNNSFRLGPPSFEESATDLTNMVSVVDLRSPDLDVRPLALEAYPTVAVGHPDGRRALVNSDHGFVAVVVEDGTPRVDRVSRVDESPLSFDIHPQGHLILATTMLKPLRDVSGLDDYLGNCCEIHAYTVSGGDVRHLARVPMVGDRTMSAVKPFDVRISPDGTKALAIGGAGFGGKGTLDDVLVIDLTSDTPVVADVIPQVGDGMETLAFQPTGRFAVVGVLGARLGQASVAHLAVIDLTTEPARLLYHMPIDSIPEGIEFTPDGALMFVVTTAQNHLAVFDVDGMTLKRKDFVLPTGHGPTALAIGPTFEPSSALR